MPSETEMTDVPRLGLPGRLAAAFQANPLTPVLALLGLLLGLVAVLVTPREEEPQIDVTMANVFVPYPGASAREVEQLVSTPLEQKLSEIEGIKHVYSISRPGMAVLTVEYIVGVQRQPAIVRLYNQVFSNQDWLPQGLGVGQPLLALYAPGALRIQVQVPQSDADAIRGVGRAAVLLDDGRRVDAASVAVFPSADPATHSVAVRVVLPSMAQAPSPGATARVVFAIAGQAGTGSVRIPRSALVQRGEVSGVYVIDGNRIALRQLRLGRPVGDGVEVLAGLTPGERIATDPVAALQALVSQRDAAGPAHD
jgi:hypothetical protein